MSEHVNNISRILDEMPRSWPETMVTLIDALREYIRACVNDADDMLQEGMITKEEYDAGTAMTVERKLLAELEAHEIDPLLRGTIKR